MKRLNIEPLEQSSFAPFGDVIDTRRADAQRVSINDCFTQRHHALSPVQTEGNGPILSVFETRSFGFPLQIRMLERHPNGSQAFIPMGDSGTRDFLIVVPQGEQAPDPDTIRAFRVGSGQGVNFHAGVWHHPNIVIEGSQTFLVVDRADPASNLEEFTFPDDIGPIWLEV